MFRTTIEDAPAFRILRNLGTKLKGLRPAHKLGRIQAATRDLQELYTQRASYPTDLTDEGENILHRVCSLWCDTATEDLAQKDLETILGEYRELLLYAYKLVRAVGISVNETNIFGYHILTVLGSPNSDSLAEAVSSRDIERLRRLLCHIDGTNLSLDLTGHSCLHLAAGWPAGVAALVVAAPHLVNLRSSCSSELPIHHACHLECIESVEILLNHGSSLGQTFRHALLYAIESGNKQIIDLVIDALAERRLRLRNMADACLPQSTLKTLKPDRLPDADVRIILAELGRLSITVPAALEPELWAKSGRTVYHALYDFVRPGLSAVAQKLYDTGFRDFDCLYYGLTPLQQGPTCTFFSASDDADLALWLLTHGAAVLIAPVEEEDTDRTHARRMHGPIHFLARRIGASLHIGARCLYPSNLLGLKDPDSPLSHVLEAIAFSPANTDVCVCACAPPSSGCTPLTIFLRHLNNPGTDSPNWGVVVLFAAWLNFYHIYSLRFCHAGPNTSSCASLEDTTTPQCARDDHNGLGGRCMGSNETVDDDILDCTAVSNNVERLASLLQTFSDFSRRAKGHSDGAYLEVDAVDMVGGLGTDFDFITEVSAWSGGHHPPRR
ncbi:hypothetical protein B0T25DRAFT_603271 [Lasiosphaeria hispida]|uniref:Ankyrin n=1 Tax=Lasiosphaeria hispida TaxID=260671 RepID=A0AAJ0HLD0_9PEZI|nr:hypothetical protein B0T25DRAFT_603271 [Lasiosphaeria hispida]